AKVSCWLIRLLILGSGYNTMISHLGLIRTFLKVSEVNEMKILISLPFRRGIKVGYQKQLKLFCA
ncbi:hypothetical protein, partial [Klebsiella pneumoniae]|uniref:hypothetical protein n=1 Tax=Klebsiella pneumoniae TaxID=573 RepID=UPI001C6FC8CC